MNSPKSTWIEVEQVPLRRAAVLRLRYFRPRQGILASLSLPILFLVLLVRSQNYILLHFLIIFAVSAVGVVVAIVVVGDKLEREGFKECRGNYVRLLVRTDSEEFWTDPPYAYMCLGPGRHELVDAPASGANQATPLDRKLAVQVWGPRKTVVGVRGVDGHWLPARRVKYV